MGRPRKHNKHLPRGMLQRRGTYFYVRGDNPWVNLGREFGPALVRYAGIVGTAPQVTTVGDAIAHYLEWGATRAQGPLAPATLEGYRQSAANLAPVFGHMGLTDLTSAHVYRYLTERGNVQANRDRALLSAAYSHARRIGALPKLADDPTKGLEYRNAETPRQRYVTDAEMSTLLAAASPKLATIARFIELTGMRQGDALRVRLEDLDAEGIHYQQGKTGARLVILWSPELEAVVEDAKRLWRRFGRVWLFESHPKTGKREVGPYTPSGLRAMWRRVRVKSGVMDARLHDLRRKAGSDVATEQDAQRLLGHADGKVTRRHYRAKADRVKPVR